MSELNNNARKGEILDSKVLVNSIDVQVTNFLYKLPTGDLINITVANNKLGNQINVTTIKL